jgi:hypothetical protein
VARDHGRVHGYLANVAAVKLVLSIALLLVAAAIVNLGGWPADARAAVYIVGLGVAIENLGRTWHSVFQALERMEFISISLILQRVVTAAAGIAALAAGGVGIAYAVGGGDSEEQVTGPDAEKAKAAALEAVGGGTVTEAEYQEAGGAGVYEVEVQRPDGSEVEVHIGSDFNAVGTATDDDTGSEDEGSGEDEGAGDDD